MTTLYINTNTNTRNTRIKACSSVHFPAFDSYIFHQISGFFIALLEQMRLTNLMIPTDKQYIVWGLIENQAHWYVHRDKCIVFYIIVSFHHNSMRINFHAFSAWFFFSDKTYPNVSLTYPTNYLGFWFEYMNLLKRKNWIKKN